MDTEEAQGADRDSRLFLTVSGCSSAGNSRSSKTTSHNRAAGPLHKLWRRFRGESPRASADLPAAEPRRLPLVKPGGTSLCIHL